MGIFTKLFCKHKEETEFSFNNTDGERCYIAFCCECGVLRYFEKFYKGKPAIQHNRVGLYGGPANKYIVQYAEPGYNHNPIAFREDGKRELWESGYFDRRTDADKQAQKEPKCFDDDGAKIKPD